MLMRNGIWLTSGMDTLPADLHVNCLIAILYRGGQNHKLLPDGELSNEFNTALRNLRGMRACPKKTMISTELIWSLKGSGYNHRKLNPDGTLGKEFRIALKELRAKLKKAAEEAD